MSAILSADDLNDFISPGVACVKPIEILPNQEESSNPYEVTTEDKVAATNAPPAQISLTDCLACSGCVTSAEAVLVSLQSHTEVLNTLDSHPSLPPHSFADHGQYTLTNGYANGVNGHTNGLDINPRQGKLFIASISPQVCASIAATFNVPLRVATNMIHQLLAGPQGLASGGPHGSSFTWILDTNTVREITLVGAADEVYSSRNSPKDAVAGQEGALEITPKKPILTSACPGWICYAEKTHPHVLPHLSRLKSPQALAGTLVKSVLARKCGIRPDQIWHLALMPCFDKKLEASREELTSGKWEGGEGIRDVDCVITARELLMLAQSRGINFLHLPRTPVDQPEFPDPVVGSFLFRDRVAGKALTNGHGIVKRGPGNGSPEAGPSGGYLHHILSTYQVAHPGSKIITERGRNADVVEYRLTKNNETVIRMARYYGFRNIQNLVRRLRPAKVSKLAAAGRGTAKSMVGRRAGPVKANGVNASNGTNGTMGNGNGAVARGPAGGKEEDYAYVEVMACPGGCTNGGGQVRVQELADIQGAERVRGAGPAQQREWLGRVEGKYFEDSEYEGTSSDEDLSVKKISNGMNGHVNGYINGDAMDLDSPDTTSLFATNLPNHPDVINGIYIPRVRQLVAHWSAITGVDPQSLVGTGFRKVESNVGKKASDTERVAGLAVAVGGGW